MKRTIVLLIFYIPLVSCVSLSGQGEKVFVTSNPKRIEGCKFIGQVVSSSSWGVVGATDAAYDNTMNEIRNKAGQMGANVVLTTTISNTMGGIKKVGEAYECE
jgi:uncharacterized protein YbjQ (UPF0145 family)